MATMNISLPDQMKAWVESQAESGRYSNASDYVRDLIRQDQRRADAIAELQEIYDHAVQSGLSERTPEEIFAQARERAASPVK